MKAVILAAGDGSRLNGIRKNNVKPLTRLLGLSLLERAILSAKKAGINEFVIVLGYKGEMIKNEIGNGNKYGVRIEYAENHEWEKGNGTSAMKAEGLAGEKFILMMTDHVFDPEILMRLRNQEIEDGCILCIDRAPAWYIDMDDATKVRVEGDRIVDTGKGLKEYDAVDCGIFLCTNDIFDALKEAQSHGKYGLSDGVRELAKRGKVRIMDITGSFWMDIDTPSNLRNAERVMLERLIKKTDGPVSRYLNRKISLRISKRIARYSVNPDSISVSSFLTGVFSALFFSLGNYATNILAGILAQLSSIIDGCDGEIARMKLMDTKNGGWFDAVLDRYADFLIIMGMCYGYWLIHGSHIIWVVGILALSGSFMISYTADKYRDKKIIEQASGKFQIPASRDVRLFIVMLGAVVSHILLALLTIAFLTHIEVMRRIYMVMKN